MTTTEETITASGVPAYLARPAGDGPFPTVIVFFEAFGLNGHIKDVARRLAREGYVAIAPDLYHRIPGPRSAEYSNLEAAFALAATLKDEEAIGDTRAVLEYLGSRPDVQQECIGTIGFCLGGRLAFLAACQFPETIKAAAPFYGGAIASRKPFGEPGTPPLEFADRIRGRLRLFYGGLDAHIPREQVRAIASRLEELGKDAQVVVYPNADHGFFCDQRPSYNPDAARDAWARTLELFAVTLSPK